MPQAVRGVFPLRVECAPAFNYARSKHTLKIIPDLSIPTTDNAPTAHEKALFSSSEAGLALDLRYVAESSLAGVPEPQIELKELDLTKQGHLGLSTYCELELHEGQAITFLLRTPPGHIYPEAARPSPEKAKQLGVPYESRLFVKCTLIVLNISSPAELVMGASNLRAPDDPLLTKVRRPYEHFFKSRLTSR